MRDAQTYAGRLIQSWRIPVCGLLVVFTHWVVERYAGVSGARGPLILVSIFVCPFVVSLIMRGRRALWSTIVNGAFLTLSFGSYVIDRETPVRSKDWMEFLTVLGFALACGAAASAFFERLGRRLSAL